MFIVYGAGFAGRSFLWPPKRSEGGSEGWAQGLEAFLSFDL